MSTWWRLKTVGQDGVVTYGAAAPADKVNFAPSIRAGLGATSARRSDEEELLTEEVLRTRQEREDRADPADLVIEP